MEKIYVDVTQTHRKNKKKLFSLNLKIYKNKKKSFEALLSEDQITKLIYFSSTFLVSFGTKSKKRLRFVNKKFYLERYSDFKSDEEIKNFIKNWAIIIAYEIKFQGKFEHIYHAIAFATKRLNSKKSNNYYNLTAEFISKAFKLEAELS